MIVFSLASVWHALVAKSISDAEGYVNSIYILEPASQSVYERVSLIVGEHNLFYLGKKKSGFKSGIEVLKLKLYPPINPLKVEKLYYFCPWSPYQRVFCHFSKNAIITRVEDGVRDYLSIPFDNKKISWLNLLAKRFMCISEYYKCDFSDYYTESFLLSFIPHKFKGSKLISKSLLPYKGNIKKTLDRLSITKEAERCIGSFINSKLVLIIGQSLSEDGSMSLEEECRVYNDYIKDMVEKGCNVIFKPHPRSSKKKIEFIFESNKKYCENFLCINTNDMVEQFLNTYTFEEVVGMWSIPVIYGAFLFDVKPKSLMKKAIVYSKDSRINEIHNSLQKELSEYYCDFI